jgi:hypothetical protein
VTFTEQTEEPLTTKIPEPEPTANVSKGIGKLYFNIRLIIKQILIFA